MSLRHRWLWSLLVVVACSDDAGIPDARPVIDAPTRGQLMLAWTIGHAGAALTCAQVDAVSVTIEMLPVGAAFGVVDSLSCTSAMGTSSMILPGVYDVRVTLEGSGGPLAGPVMQRNVAVGPGEIVPLAPIAFDVDPQGDLVFRLTTPEIGNCTPVAQGGAGITAVSIELRDAANVCVPTTFAVAAGASQPAGSYRSDCASATHACIATDQDVRATAVTSGQHTMVVTGLVIAAPCWKRTTTFRVRAAGQLTTLSPVQLTLDTTVAGCPAP